MADSGVLCTTCPHRHDKSTIRSSRRSIYLCMTRNGSCRANSILNMALPKSAKISWEASIKSSRASLHVPTPFQILISLVHTRTNKPTKSSKTCEPSCSVSSPSSSASRPLRAAINRLLRTHAVLPAPALPSVRCSVVVQALSPVTTVAGYTGIVAREPPATNFLLPVLSSVATLPDNPRPKSLALFWFMDTYSFR